jgi:hypothetical protein
MLALGPTRQRHSTTLSSRRFGRRTFPNGSALSRLSTPTMTTTRAQSSSCNTRPDDWPVRRAQADRRLSSVPRRGRRAPAITRAECRSGQGRSVAVPGAGVGAPRPAERSGSRHTSRAAGWPAHDAAAAEPSSRRAGSVAALRSGPGEPQDDGVPDEDSESDRDEGDGGVDEVIEPGRAIGADELGDADQADRAGTSSQNAGRKVASGGGPDGRFRGARRSRPQRPRRGS